MEGWREDGGEEKLMGGGGMLGGGESKVLTANMGSSTSGWSDTLDASISSAANSSWS